MSIDHATSLKALQLFGMATAWSELQAEKPKRFGVARGNRPVRLLASDRRPA